MTDEIETVYSTDWIPGFQCEGMGYIGSDGTAYYWAFHISPQQDEQDLYWHGPVTFAADAKRHMNELIGRWQKCDDERWQDWEDNQISEFERQNKAKETVDKS